MNKIILAACVAMLSTTVNAQYNQQSPKLTVSGLPSTPAFGGSVSIAADASTAIVGAWGGASGAVGQAIIMNRTGSVWTQGQLLIGSGANGGANQGNSVAISADGNTAVVGGPGDNGNAGAVWVFTRSGTTWTQQGTELEGTGASGNANQGFAVTISADGNTILSGGPANNQGLGAVWVFVRSGSNWTQQATLIGSDAISSSSYPSMQGFAVALSADGNTAIFGGPRDGGDHGAAWVFTRSGNNWLQQGGKFTGSALQPIGTSVAISADGNTCAVGAAGADSKTGGTYIAVRLGATWTPQGTILQGTLPVGHAQQGGAVSMSADGNTVVIGGAASVYPATSADIGIGACWIFIRAGSIWAQQGNKYVGTGNVGNSQQGASVSITADGNTFITGGFGDNSGAGAVWVFSTTLPINTSVFELPAGTHVSIYPNPAQNIIYITSEAKLISELVSMTGKTVMGRNEKAELDITSLAAGVYLLNLYDATGLRVKTEKIIKQ